MNIETQIEETVVQSHLTEDIDAGAYLVNNLDTICESSGGFNDVEVDVEDEINHEVGQDENDEVLGQEFESPTEAYTFYNRYAFMHGFGVRIHLEYKNKVTNEAYRKIFVCNKQGFKNLNDKRFSGNDNKRRRVTRTGCQAMLRIAKRKDGKWFVDTFSDTHNHPLSNTPTKVIKHRSHGKHHLAPACKSLISDLGQSGLRPCQIKKAVNAMKDPNEADVTAKQCSDILSVQRKQYKGKEFYGLIKHFQDKGLTDPNQFIAIDLFDDGSPRNIFWADGRSRYSYVTFGDVVVFDVTYMTNKFKMPFAPFVGVNHHGQSIIFGAALLENEKEETFVWLFENFLRCMHHKSPPAIITDQDKAIGNAIKKVFPSARHRFCAWHIKKHEIEHLQSLRARYSDFQDTYTQWVKSDTIDEFEVRWESILGKFNVQNDSWLVNMYNLREHWAKAFLNDVFFAGMTTSGRSESINSFFDGFVNSKTMLNEFVVQYDKAVESRRAAEEDEDFKTMNTKPDSSFVHPIEARAGECYTRKMFEVFKKEWREATSVLTHEKLSKSSDIMKYRVGNVNVDKERWRTVDFHISEDFKATCSCAKFETYGMLCKHMLYIMKKRNVLTLPDHYIMRRWTLEARYRRDNADIGLEGLDIENGVSSLSLWCIQTNCAKAIEESRDSPSDLKKFNTFVVKHIEEQKLRKATKMRVSQQECSIGVSQLNMMPQTSVRDPVGFINTKGRPKNVSRIKSPLETTLGAGEKKKRMCSYCKILGHYATGCPKKKVDDVAKSQKGAVMEQ